MSKLRKWPVKGKYFGDGKVTGLFIVGPLESDETTVQNTPEEVVDVDQFNRLIAAIVEIKAMASEALRLDRKLDRCRIITFCNYRLNELGLLYARNVKPNTGSEKS